MCSNLFLLKNRFNATKTFEMIQKVYGESTVHRATVFCWYNVFLDGWKSIRDEQKSERPTTTTRTRDNIAYVADILKEDRRFLCRIIAEWTGIPKAVVQQILHEDLPKWKLCAWFVWYALTAKQKEQRLNHAYDLIEMIKSNPNFLGSIITGDESWCFASDLETKCRSSKWCGPKTPPYKKFLFQKSQVKTLLILFFDSIGVTHNEYVPEGQTVNATFYVHVLDCFCNRIVYMRSEMWRSEVLSSPRWCTFTHCSGCPAVESHSIFARFKTPPIRLYHFPKIKIWAEGEHYALIEDIQKSVTAKSKAFPLSDFRRAMKWLEDRTNDCIRVSGDYFE